jgi:hypothetical protein
VEFSILEMIGTVEEVHSGMKNEQFNGIGK